MIDPIYAAFVAACLGYIIGLIHGKKICDDVDKKYKK